MKALLYVLGATVMLSPVGAIAQERGDSRLTASLSSPPLELQSAGCPNSCGPKDTSLLMGNSDDSRRSDLIGAVVGAGIGFALTWGACASAEVCTDGLVVVGALVGGLVGAGIGSRIGNGDSDEPEPEERSAAVVASWQVSCTDDPRNHRDHVFKMLTDPAYENWRTRVGLTDVNANELAVVTDDSTCQAIWAGWTRAPKTGFFTTFFRVEDFYIVTEYPNSDPALGPVALGRGLTTVLDEQLRLVPPVWAE